MGSPRPTGTCWPGMGSPSAARATAAMCGSPSCRATRSSWPPCSSRNWRWSRGPIRSSAPSPGPPPATPGRRRAARRSPRPGRDLPVDNQDRLPLARRGHAPGLFRYDPASRCPVPMNPAGRSGLVATWAALIVVYLVWGSTYLGIRVLVGFAPPLLAMGVRFLCAGVLLAAFLAVRHGPGILRVPPRRLLSAGVIGVLLLTCGNGGVAVAEQTVPSGLAALLVAEIPLWLVCLRLLARDTPRRATIAGTAVGFVGIAILALPGSHPAGTALWGILMIIGATLCWSSGTFATPRVAMPSNPFVAATYEMVTAGVVLLAAGAAAGELGRVHLATVPPHAWLALAYLIVFGSLVAFSAYVWLLGNAPLSLIATYAYVNPVVAVILGALILGEQVTRPILIGGAVVVAGVGLVVSVERPRRQSAQAPDQAGPPSPAMPRPDGPRASAKPSIRR